MLGVNGAENGVVLEGRLEGGGGLGQEDITVKEQEARLTSVPSIICSVGAVSGRGPDVR